MFEGPSGLEILVGGAVLVGVVIGLYELVCWLLSFVHITIG